MKFLQRCGFCMSGKCNDCHPKIQRFTIETKRGKSIFTWLDEYMLCQCKCTDSKIVPD